MDRVEIAPVSTPVQLGIEINVEVINSCKQRTIQILSEKRFDTN